MSSIEYSSLLSLVLAQILRSLKEDDNLNFKPSRMIILLLQSIWSCQPKPSNISSDRNWIVTSSPKSIGSLSNSEPQKSNRWNSKSWVSFWVSFIRSNRKRLRWSYPFFLKTRVEHRCLLSDYLTEWRVCRRRSFPRVTPFRRLETSA